MQIALQIQIHQLDSPDGSSPQIVDIPLLEREDGALVVGDEVKIEVSKGKAYEVWAVYSPSSSSLSLQLSNDQGLLIRFGGIVASTFGMATSLPEINRHIEVVFSKEKS